jgi:beta-glucanase (GH16 family)
MKTHVRLFKAMKKSITTIFFSAACLCMQAQTTWQLLWSDEFSGDALNTSNWSYQFGNGGWGNNEWQYYTNADENIEVSDGQLKITARHEGTGPTEYTSARIITKGQFDVEFGKIEARMKLPMGQGLWPAFWTLGANIDEVSWPECGEIDIMEHVSNEYMTHGAVHWDNNGHTYVGGGVNTDPTQYHVYGIIWEEDLIRWYIDGVQFYQFTIQASNNSDDAFRHPMFLLLNLAVGGNWPGYPDDTTPFPSSMYVDYVRVYQPTSQTSIYETENFQIEINPNPAASQVTVQFNKVPDECAVIDLAGRKALTLTLAQAQSTIDVSALPAGYYILECQYNGQRYTRPFVKE